MARYVRPLCEGRLCAPWARSRVASLGLGQRRLQDASRAAEYQAGKKERKQPIWKHSNLVKSFYTLILHSYQQVMQQRQVAGVWNSAKDELPIEIDLGSDCRFHSIFACPILRQQTTDSNPPMRLTCGHCISRDALNKLSSGHKLKCPYCPVEQNPNDARQITF